MRIENAIKKLKKAGARVEIVKQGEETGEIKGYFSNGYMVDLNFDKRYDRVDGFRVRGINEKDDFQTDYFAGVWCKNLGRAIKVALS